MAANPTFIYGSAVTFKKELIQVWGQSDRDTVRIIERTLADYGPQLTRLSYPDLRSISVGTICVSYNSNGKFYRCAVESMMDGNLVAMFTLDYGFTFFIDVRNIRILSFNEPLVSFPPQAQGFFIAEALKTNTASIDWFESDVKNLVLKVHVLADHGENNKIARIFRESVNITNQWMEKKWAKSVTVRSQEQIVMDLLTTGPPPSPPHSLPESSRYPPLAPATLRNVTVPKASNPSPTQFISNPAIIKALVAAEVKEQIGIKKEVVESPPAFELSQYRVTPILPGAAYHIIVSAVIDGPWLFSVQMKPDFQLLIDLKNELAQQNVEKYQMKPPLSLGKPCLVYHLMRKEFCRGVIVHVTHKSATVTFVDYGFSEEVSLPSIYELPPLAFKTKLLAHNFSLSNIGKLTNDDMPDLAKAFAEIVEDNELLMMQVCPAEENCLQTCDLFVGNANVKALLNQRMQSKRRYVLEAFPSVGRVVPVYLTHVESVHRFYVQLRKREADIEKLSDEIQNISHANQLLKESDLRPGMPCLGQFLEDMQWYRGKINSISEDSVNVFFVDYGNDMTVLPSTLKQIPGEIVKRLPAQALLCELAGVAAADEILEKLLPDLLNDDTVTMTVKSIEKNKMSVSLAKGGVDLVTLSKPAKVVSSNVDSAQTSWRQRSTEQPPAQRSSITKPSTNNGDEWNSPPEKRHHRERWRKVERHDDFDCWNRPYPTNYHRRNGGAPNQFSPVEIDDEHRPKFGSRGFNRRGTDDGEDSGGRFGGKEFQKKSDAGGFKSRDEDSGSRFNGKSFNRRDNENGEEGGGRFGKFSARDNNDEGGGFRRRDENKSEGFGGRSFVRREDSEERGGRFGAKGFGRRGDTEESGGGFGGKGSFQRNEGGGGFQKFGDSDGGDFKKSFKSFGNEGGSFGRGERQDDRPRREPIRNEDRAPPGSNFPEPRLEPEATIEGILTYYVNPGSFFVQIQSDVSKFTEIMQEMQTDYVNKFSFRESETLDEGTIVVAKFSDDRVLYRAEVITTDPLTVRFVDYGNTQAITNRRDVYPVMRKLLDLPVQSLHCSLDGVNPIGESWTPDTSRVFQVETMSVKLISENDRVWQVSASSGGKDLAEQLVAEGLATSSSEAVGQLADAGAEVAESPVVKILKIDIELLPGELLAADIPYIYNADKFFAQFHVESVDALQGIILDQLSEPDARKVLEVSAVAPGTLCIASTLEEPDVLYRAKVVQLVETGALVQFFDYGDMAEVPFTQIFEINDELAGLPDLAIECSLQGDVTTVPQESHDKFKTELEGGRAIIHVHQVDTSCDYPRLKVTVYDPTGKKLKIQDGLNDSPAECGLPFTPLVASTMKVNILDFTSTSTVLLQLPDGDDFLIPEEPAPGEVPPDMPCAVLCEDGCWRRANVDDGSAFLVDTGFVEAVTDARPLPSVLRGESCVVREVTMNYPALGVVLVSVKREDTGLVIEPAVKTGFVSHVETATTVYFTPDSVSKRLDEIQEAIGSSVAEATEEELLVAKYPEDGLWYRAKVLEREPLKVQFLDYGNSSEVDEVAPMPADFAVIPPLAVRISLAVELPEAAKEQLEELLAAAENPLTLVEVEGRAVDFLLNGRSVIAQLKGQPELFSGSNVVVSHVVDSTELYLQREVDTQVLTEIEERLADVTALEPLTGPTEDVVAAAFEDGAWYRARFQNDELYFVDFGNRAPAGDLRALPADLVTIPPMAIRVSLIPAENTDDPLQLCPGGSLLTDLLNVPLRLQEVTSADGVISVRLTDQTSAPARSGPRRNTSDQTDDAKSAGMSRNETDEEKRDKIKDLLNVPDSELEAAAQLDDSAPGLEFEVPEYDQSQETRQPVEAVMSPTPSLPDDVLSQQGERIRGMSDEDLIASGDVTESAAVVSTSMSDEDLLQRDETQPQDSVPDDERLSSEDFSRAIVNEVVSAISSSQTGDIEDVSDEENAAPVESEVSREINEIAANDGVSLSDEALLERYESLAQEAVAESQNGTSEEIAKSLGIEDVGNINIESEEAEWTEASPQVVNRDASEDLKLEQNEPEEAFHSLESVEENLIAESAEINTDEKGSVVDASLSYSETATSLVEEVYGAELDETVPIDKTGTVSGNSVGDNLIEIVETDTFYSRITTIVEEGEGADTLTTQLDDTLPSDEMREAKNDKAAATSATSVDVKLEAESDDTFSSKESKETIYELEEKPAQAPTEDNAELEEEENSLENKTQNLVEYLRESFAHSKDSVVVNGSSTKHEGSPEANGVNNSVDVSPTAVKDDNTEDHTLSPTIVKEDTVQVDTPTTSGPKSGESSDEATKSSKKGKKKKKKGGK